MAQAPTSSSSHKCRRKATHIVNTVAVRTSPDVALIQHVVVHQAGGVNHLHDLCQALVALCDGTACMKPTPGVATFEDCFIWHLKVHGFGLQQQRTSAHIAGRWRRRRGTQLRASGACHLRVCARQQLGFSTSCACRSACL